MRRLRIAAPAQLSLHLRVADDEPELDDLWENLPEPTQAELLSLIARLIARGVVFEEEAH
ncbi:MAG: hypothetical protein ACRDV4_03565 [Acidimicrobiales bacterium]